MVNNSKVCLLCDASTISSRNNFSIFTQTVSSTDRKLVEIISKIINIEIEEKTIHSIVICKKCFKLFNEIDEIEHRLIQLKKEIIESYEKTQRKQTEGILEFVEDEETNPNPGDGDTFEPKKPSSSYKKKTKSTTNQKPPQTQSRTVVTVKLMDMTNDETTETSATNQKSNSIKSEFILGDDGDDDDGKKYEDCDFSSDDDRVMEVDEDDLPLTFEVTEENVPIKKRRGRPKKIKNHNESKLTSDLIVQKLPNSDNYKCILCTEQDNASAKDIIHHVRMCHDIKLYICDMCGEEFLKRSLLHVHLDEHMSLNEEGEFQCETCNRIFTNLRLFRVHKKIHFNNNQNKSYFCEFCGKTFSTQIGMEQHVLSHTGDRPFKCSTCEKTFRSKYCYNSHTKVHEADRDRPFKCVNCGKSFFTQQNLFQHERTHSGLKDYVCSECGKAFATSRGLETHLTIHSGNKPFICRLCGKAFTRNQEIKDHERTHTGERPYQCELCGSQFSQKSNLISHKRTTHFNDKRYSCTYCDKAFKRRRLLDYHTKSQHTGERPYKCDLCDASFIYPEHHKKHKRTHTGEKPYLCELCGKAFNSRDNRNAHRFVHSDKKPYECVTCGAGFMRKPLLYVHIQNMGHESDKIVVNQPQLITHSENFNTIFEDADDDVGVEMTLVQDADGEHKLVPLNILSERDEEGEDSNLSTNHVEQLIINEHGQVEMRSKIEETDLTEIENLHSEGSPLPDGDVTMTNIVQDSTILETEDGPVHLVQIRLPDEKGELRETWVNFVSQTE